MNDSTGRKFRGFTLGYCRIVAGIVFFLLAAGVAEAASGGSPPALDGFIENQMQKAHVPGLSACVVAGGETVWAGGYGWADIEREIPVTPDIIFMLASISKTVTGTALMKVRENRAFNLDGDVNEFLPFSVENPNHPGDPVTFRQLLAHGSSICDNWDVLERFYTDGDSPIPLGFALRHYLAPGGLVYYPDKNYYSYAPGRKYNYSNVGFALNGYLVETITGVPFDEFCSEQLFGPLDMHETSWFLRDLDVDRIAVPYNYNYWTQRYVPLDHYGYPDYPDGQLRTSAIHLANFLSMHINLGTFGEARILEEDTVREMRTIQYPQHDSGFGLAFYYWEHEGETRLGHNGGDSGACTEMWYRPDDGVGVIVLANGGAYLQWEYAAIVAIVNKLFEAATDLGSRGALE